MRKMAAEAHGRRTHGHRALSEASLQAGVLSLA